MVVYLESMDIDYHAQMNRFYSISPYSKIFFSLSALTISIAAPSLAVSMVCFLVFTFLILFSKTPRKLYFLLLAEVFLFAALNLAIFSFFLGKEILLEIYSFYIYRDGLKLGLLLFFRMLAGFSCLYFLISTTPSTQLFSALSKIGIPEVFLEAMALIYRYIFLIFDDAGKMMIALRSRIGTFGFKKLGSLMANVFIRSFERQERMWSCMASRCYDGKYPVLRIESAKINELIPIILFDFILIILALNTAVV